MPEGIFPITVFQGPPVLGAQSRPAMRMAWLKNFKIVACRSLGARAPPQTPRHQFLAEAALGHEHVEPKHRGAVVVTQRCNARALSRPPNCYAWNATVQIWRIRLPHSHCGP